jgi:non-ribosomal peptide synthetase component E (peptide arylation enzyme)
LHVYVTGGVDEVARSIGYAAPIYPMSIREPMHGDGRAGAEVPAGTVGHVCFRGPQTFLGYVNDRGGHRRHFHRRLAVYGRSGPSMPRACTSRGGRNG